MIYAQDEPVVFPVADLYDSGMMGAYLSAVKDLYERGLKELQEFTAKYGDFTSPFAKDVQFWNEHTMDPIVRAINEMRANGIDPARSPEARALLLNLRMNVPYATLALMKQSAEVAKEYLKNRGALAAAGKYNSDYERYLLGQLGLPEFEKFSTAQNGMWTRTTPSVYQDLNAATSEWFDDLKPRDLGLDPTGRYRMTGVTEQDLMNSLTPHLSGFVGGDLGGYHYNNAKKELISEGIPNPTTKQILDRLSENIVTASHERVYTNYDADDYSKMDAEFQNAVKLENIRTANNIKEYEAQKQIDAMYDQPTYSDGGGGGSESGIGYAGPNGTIIPRGPADNLAIEQLYVYNDYVNSFSPDPGYDENKAWNNQLAAYNKLTPSLKSYANQYAKAYHGNDTNTLNTLNAQFKDKNLLEWKKKFLYHWSNREKILKRTTRTTTLGLAGYNTKPRHDLLEHSYSIYNKANVVDKELSADDKNTIFNSTWGLGWNGKNYTYSGTVTSGTKFKPIVVADLTGSRMYTYNSFPRLLDRLIRNKTFTVGLADKNGAQYASGDSNRFKKRVNSVSVMAHFLQDDIKEYLDKFTDSGLRQYGIKRILKDDGETTSEYIIPITKSQLVGTQGWADTNSSGDLRFGQAEGKKNRLYRQSSAEMNRVAANVLKNTKR